MKQFHKAQYAIAMIAGMQKELKKDAEELKLKLQRVFFLIFVPFFNAKPLAKDRGYLRRYFGCKSKGGERG